MSDISETYNRTQNILEIVVVLPCVSFTTSETERDFYNKWNGTWLLLIKVLKNELTDELSNNVKLKKISELHGIIV